MHFDALIAVCFGYASILFVVAFLSERAALRGRARWLRSPVVYTLSLSVYCTAWTFYGAVGTATRNGLEFVTIYLGPSLVMFAWWGLLRKMVRIGATQRITSVADLISSRYGKSARLGVIVTVLAVLAGTPYIALQLQSLVLSVTALAEQSAPAPLIGFCFALGLAAFAVLFGTREIDVNERHFGVVSAVAFEAVVKLVALLSVGVFVVWSLAPEAIPPVEAQPILTPRWVTLTFLSAAALICLPRMFQVLIVENASERHLATAAWAFPLYLLLISAFVLPIAAAGQERLPDGNPDLYVMTVPLEAGRPGLALLSFLGGFSAATSMVIVSAIALSTMISNHIAVPLWLRLDRTRTQTSGDVRKLVLTSRRVSIVLIVLLGYVYFLVSGGSVALASIGLISFAGVAQILPALLGALYWRSANRWGAMAGIVAGSAVWAYTLLLPSFEGGFLLSARTLAEGPFGIALLRPQALFGLEVEDPLVHAMFWSMTVNVTAFVGLSLLTAPGALERVQAAQFVDVFRLADEPPEIARQATSEDLYALAQRILGTTRAHAMFAAAARAQGKSGGLPDADERLIGRIERDLTGAVGAASAHAMVSQITRGGQVSVDTLIRMADETAQIVEYSQELERQSTELASTAAELRQANERLRELSAQKDAFLSQVSHELRTPMTSIRSFAEILRAEPTLSRDEVAEFVGIIHDESRRLTRLLDEILDLSVLEAGHAKLRMAPTLLSEVIGIAVTSTEGLRRAARIPIEVEGPTDQVVMADPDRLKQVLINLVSNAVKYATADVPRIRLRVRDAGDAVTVDVIDNGPGIAPENRERIFEKFAQLGETTQAGSAGLGLAISREIMRNLGGDLTFEDGEAGACFRLRLRRAEAAQAAE